VDGVEVEVRIVGQICELEVRIGAMADGASDEVLGGIQLGEEDAAQSSSPPRSSSSVSALSLFCLLL
jgi:hypothetical protein